MAATGTAEPELAAALAIAACRTVHLQAIRAILAGQDAASVAARHPGRIRSALAAVDQMTTETALEVSPATSPPTSARRSASSRALHPKIAGSGVG
jgi:hypothetical protein